MDFDGPVPGIPGANIHRVNELPEHLPGGEPAGPHVQAKPGQLLLTVPGVCRYLVRDGTSIEFAPAPDADPGAVRLFLNGSARGALIHQRGELPLHAATLVPPGGETALAICGGSGAGKSTLAAELSRRGWLLVADDTTRITWNETHAMAWPSRDSIKLWRDACDTNDLDVAGLERVTAALDKYYLHVPALSQPVRLAAVCELLVDGQEPQGALSLGGKMSLLTRHTYRQAYIRPLGRQADFVRLVSLVANTCRIGQFLGGRSLPVRELADAVEQSMK